MTVRLTPEKIENIKNLCTELYHKIFTTIRKCSRLVGMLVAGEPGILSAPFYYRPLGKYLNHKHRNVDAYMKIPSQICCHLQ